MTPAFAVTGAGGERPRLSQATVTNLPPMGRHRRGGKGLWETTIYSVMYIGTWYAVILSLGINFGAV